MRNFSINNSSVASETSYVGMNEQKRISTLRKLTLTKKLHSKTFSIGLQVGHWKNRELPDELKKIRENDGASSGNTKEWEINYEITTLTAKILAKENLHVEVLPATLPPGYKADMFVAIHADQNPKTTITGFKATGAWNDVTGKASLISRILEKEYTQTTGMKKDFQITRAMKQYYAFNHQKFVHTIHPDTPGVIVETGFLTNVHDKRMLLNYPEIPARGLANGIIASINELEKEGINKRTAYHEEK